MRAVLFALFLGMVFSARSISPAAATEPLLFYSEENPPLNYTHPETGEFTGAATELIREIMRKADLPYSVMAQPWKRGYRSTQAEKNACIYGTVWSTDRADHFKWVGPLFTGGWAVYQKKDGTAKATSIEDLKGYTVSAREGTAAFARLQAESEAQVIGAPRDDMAASLLYNGRADFWLSGVFMVGHSSSRAGVLVPELSFVWQPSRVMLACNKAVDQSIINRLNEVNASLDTLRANLMKRYSYGAALKR